MNTKVSETKIYDMLVIGGGPAGYTAALYGARAGLEVAVIERLAPGGQMALTSRIDNYPGLWEGVEGFSLGDMMKKGAERFGAKTITAEVKTLELTGKVKTAETAAGILRGRTVVYAAGADPRELGLPMEEELAGKGVSYCAECDGAFFKGKKVVVVGGGNTAAADALLLSRFCSEVTVVHRRDKLSAEDISIQRIEHTENVKVMLNSALCALIAKDGRLTGVEVKDLNTDKETEISCEGVFAAIGRKPASKLVAGQLKLDEKGYIEAGESTETSLPGVFAAGDVRTKPLRQVVTAAADGAAAAYFAGRFLSTRDE